MSSPIVPDGGAAAALRRAGIAQADALARLAEPSIRIAARRTAADALPLGASRFGGAPDVPSGFAWPERDGSPLAFLAQIDLSELQAPALPASGWLLFFYDAAGQPWGFDPKDAGGARVVHVDAARGALARRPHPEVEDGGGPFACCALRFEPAVDLADPGDDLLEKARIPIAGAHLDAYAEVAAALSRIENPDARYHHLLGNPQLVQGDMRSECQLVTRGIYVGKPEAFQGDRTQELLRAAPAEWRLLLQLDTDEDGPGWTWGDAGRIYFWIRRADLDAGAFERAWLVLQCG
jgi:uncharacterized protein YwqG